MKYGLLVWDFDGTLADTLPGAVRIFNVLAARHGFRPIEDQAAARSQGMAAFLKEHDIPLWKLPWLMREFLAAQKQEIAEVRLFPGMAAVLAALRGQGYRLAVLSSNTRENIRVCLRANEVLDHFEFVFGYARLLGKARGIRRLLKAEELAAQSLLYIGDEVRDVEAAREAGVDVAAVTWGFNAREMLVQHSPTYLMSGPADVLDLLAGTSEPEA